MQHSDQPYRELTKAQEALEEMRQAATLDEFEESWKEYLRRLERVWNKAENHFRKSPKWDSWHGPYKTLRRKDSLLSYLINARGADEHTVSEITEQESGRVTINAGPSGSLYIRTLRTGSDGEITDLDVDNDAIVQFHPGKVKILPIVNRGVSYAPPTTHLSKKIDPSNLLEIAELGIAFYEDFLSRAEAFFIS